MKQDAHPHGHLVVTAPTGGSAGVLPAFVYTLGDGGRKLAQEKIRDGFLAAAAVGYLCRSAASKETPEGALAVSLVLC